MSESKRLFFAIELPDATRQEVVRWRAEHFPQDAGRPVAAANLHLTLAFLGEVSAEKQRALETWPGAFASRALRYNWMTPGNGCVRVLSG
jgi:2'-5' RNA ligase